MDFFSKITHPGMQEFISKLKKCFEQPLPAEIAHKAMLPDIPRVGLVQNNNKSAPTKSSVLFLFYPFKVDIYTVFIERPFYNGVHSGQIAFPGGKIEKNDNNLLETALREANEEIGINKDMVSITGELSKVYISPSNYIVTPYVGFYKDKPVFKRNTREVKQIIEVPFSEILNQKSSQKANVKSADGLKYEVPCFTVKNNIIWGATAMILNELVVLWNSTN